jgi:hypothetical protein
MRISIFKILTGGIILVMLFTAGILLLVRGCLAEYDERAALAPVLHFEKDGKSVLFAIVRFAKTTSYEQDGGIIQKTYSYSYFLQGNDAHSGIKINSRRVRANTIIKHFPAEVIGAAHNHAWIFMEELQAFDPFTLEQVADIKKLEAKNPFLKGRFPAERQFYQFSETSKNINFTAIDGSLWELDTQTLLAKEKETEPVDMNAAIQTIRQMGISFNQSYINQDTAGGKWFALYSKEELNNLDGHAALQTAWNETARRSFVVSRYTNADGNAIIEKEHAILFNSNQHFLAGGFLKDKQNASVIKLSNPDSYLLVYKDKIGEAETIMISRLRTDGTTVWTFSTGLTAWVDWKLSSKELFVYGRDNKDLGSDQINALYCIDLRSGKAGRYDYFSGTSKEVN